MLKSTEDIKVNKEVISTINSESSERKKILLNKSELSIWLDSYNDIFSDFDSRPFSERALSDDFICEAKKIEKEKLSGAISLKLLMPSPRRQKAAETIIVRSIHARFRNLSLQLLRKIKRTKKIGALYSAIGLTAMIVANYLVNLQEKTFLINSLLIVLEPGGWYFVWTGLDLFFSGTHDKEEELDFNKRMAHSKIVFLSI